MSGFARCQVTSGYVSLSQFTLEGQDVELDKNRFAIKFRVMGWVGVWVGGWP